MCTKGTRGKVLIDTLDRHLDQHSIDISIDTINILIDTPSTLDRHFTDISLKSLLAVHKFLQTQQLVSIDTHEVD